MMYLLLLTQPFNAAILYGAHYKFRTANYT